MYYLVEFIGCIATNPAFQRRGVCEGQVLSASSWRGKERSFTLCASRVSRESAAVNWKWCMQELLPIFNRSVLQFTMEFTNSGDGIYFAVAEIPSVCWLSSPWF